MAGQQTGGSAAHDTIDMENGRRACKHVAARINELVHRERPEGWLLAIPAQISHLVQDHLAAEAREHLTETVHADLVKVEPSKILSHFPALQPA